jgi:hypothetical protein
MRLPLVASTLLLLVAGCGSAAATNAPGDAGGDATGTTDASSEATGTTDASSEATGTTDASGDAIGTNEAGVDVASHPDGGGACRTQAPTYHRPSATACPSHETDAGPDSGVVGCMPPHDACLVDSDCSGSGVCDCESPRCAQPFARTGNVCLAGNCRVDSDCACGFCAGDLSCAGTTGYFCTTPLDECSTDADCQGGATTRQCRWSTDHWACINASGCPG